MHFLMFQMKRAHLSALSAARKFCEEVGLTPARFDLMRAVVTLVEGTAQSALSKILGLSRVAVSKMVRRLMALGLVARARNPRDRRTFLITLTEEGLARMRRTWGRIAQEQPFQMRFEKAFGVMSAITAIAVQNLHWALRISSENCGDTSCEGFYRSRDPE